MVDTIKPSCDKVDKAMIFFRSVSTQALILAEIEVSKEMAVKKAQV